MSTINFCDTSVIIKLYHDEVGSEWMETLFNEPNATIIISELTLVELYSAVLKKVRTQEITGNAHEEAIKNFEKDCHERFIVTLLDSRVVKKAQELLKKYGDEKSIRTLDAIQLAACLNENTEGIRFICADANLLKICEQERVTVLNPEIKGVDA